MTSVYLDNHATTPVDPRVVDAMLPYLRGEFGNPSSKTHPFGWRAQEAVEIARKQIASLIGASAKEIVFTSGATESNNIAIFGSVARRGGQKKHVITQVTEHNAVLDPIKELEKQGIEVTRLSPDRLGVVSAEKVRDAIREDTALVSIMAAHNEVGSIQPCAEIGAACAERDVLFHTDAAQAIGKIPVDVEAMRVSLLSISSHKFYGPKGVGVLYVRRKGQRVAVAPSAFGGGQEGGLRPGTLNVPGIVAIGEAAKLAEAELETEMTQLRVLRDRLFESIRQQIPNVHLNGPDNFDERVPGNLSLSFAGVDGVALVMGLQDIAASSGSACSAGNSAPSHVLQAMGLPDDLASSTLRLCVGRFNTEADVDFAAERIADVVGRLKRR